MASIASFGQYTNNGLDTSPKQYQEACSWVDMIPDDDNQNNRTSPMGEAALKPNAGGEQAILRFMKDIQTYKNYFDLWEAVARLICRILNASGGGIMLLDRNNEEFFMPMASIENAQIESLFMTSRFASGKSPFENLFSRGEASAVHSFSANPGPFQDMDPRIRDFISTRLDVPLHLKEKTIGTLWAVNPKAGFFDADAAARMGALAGVTGSAMESIRFDAHLSLSNRHVKAFNLARDHAVDYLSHAIKTPLAVSIASLKLLEKQLQQVPETSWKRIYDRTERNLKRLLTIEYEMEDILRQHKSAGDELFSFLSGVELSTASFDSYDQPPSTEPEAPFPKTIHRDERT